MDFGRFFLIFLKSFRSSEQSKWEIQQGFNIRPGTLVEDTVTTIDYYDFFLTTQVGQIGLARPTHYYVLHNDWTVESSGDVLANDNPRIYSAELQALSSLKTS
ncbi:hypothetical protein B9Z55_027945 [Caenorhabditis nigoni]|uniref:Piwi domain-containing protein n=1 Tax=Caenorhabditis nigoni TaxID=1611254 RepID=A0A2G5SDP6_9PELO|nr:hypothetical protein B9Z55_027945 [Caenorhabditis nigoni]